MMGNDLIDLHVNGVTTRGRGDLDQRVMVNQKQL